MFFGKSRLLGAMVLCGWTVAGCTPRDETEVSDLPTRVDSDERSTLVEFYAYHNDQGMMADMSIADVHFVPHQKYLSGTGEARLERYAELLASTGGTLHYDTSQSDRTLIQERISVAEKFLAEAVPSNQRIQVAQGIPGGRGMSASEAMAGQEVARQPEPRGTAYNLIGAGGDVGD